MFEIDINYLCSDNSTTSKATRLCDAFSHAEYKLKCEQVKRDAPYCCVQFKQVDIMDSVNIKNSKTFPRK